LIRDIDSVERLDLLLRLTHSTHDACDRSGNAADGRPGRTAELVPDQRAARSGLRNADLATCG
jgi:hypothetical protein